MYIFLNGDFIQISQNFVPEEKMYISIGSDNGLVPIKRQVITFTKIDKSLTSRGITDLH